MAADIIIPYLIEINLYLSIEITAIGFRVQEFCLGDPAISLVDIRTYAVICLNI